MSVFDVRPIRERVEERQRELEATYRNLSRRTRRQDVMGALIVAFWAGVTWLWVLVGGWFFVAFGAVMISVVLWLGVDRHRGLRDMRRNLDEIRDIRAEMDEQNAELGRMANPN